MKASDREEIKEPDPRFGRKPQDDHVYLAISFPDRKHILLVALVGGAVMLGSPGISVTPAKIGFEMRDHRMLFLCLGLLSGLETYGLNILALLSCRFAV